MQNVTFVAPCLGGRSEVWMYRQATEINAKVNFVCKYRSNVESFPAHGCEVQILPQLVQRRQMPLLFLKLQTAWRLVRNSEVPHYFSGSVKEPAWWQDEFQRTHSKVTLVHYGTTAIKYAKLFARLKQPYVIHFHGYDLSQMVQNKTYRSRIATAANAAKALIVVADYMRDWLVEHGIRAEKIHKIPYGAPDNYLQELGVRQNDQVCTFLMVGRLTPKKAPILTIKAFERCYRQNPSARLRIIGTGELEKSCKDLVQNLGIARAVQFLGGQPSDVVLREMREASVFAQHSVTSERGDKEGWPVSIAEAASLGLPVVSTRHAGIPEQVIHNKTGLLGDEGDWTQMSENMAILAKDVRKRREFGEASKSHISQWKTSQQIAKLREVLLHCGDHN